MQKSRLAFQATRVAHKARVVDYRISDTGVASVSANDVLATKQGQAVLDAVKRVRESVEAEKSK